MIICMGFLLRKELGQLEEPGTFRVGAGDLKIGKKVKDGTHRQINFWGFSDGTDSGTARDSVMRNWDFQQTLPVQGFLVMFVCTPGQVLALRPEHEVCCFPCSKICLVPGTIEQSLVLDVTIP